MMTVFIFGVRGFISGAFQGFYVYTPEVHVIDWTKNYTNIKKTKLKKGWFILLTGGISKPGS